MPRSGSMANPERYTNPGLQTKTEMQAGVETRHRWDGGIAWSKQRPVQRQVDQADWEVYTVDAAALHLHVKVYTLLKSSTPDLVYMPGSESGDSGAHPDAAVIWGSVFHDGKLLPSRQSLAAWHDMDSVLPELSIFHRKGKKKSKFSKEFSQLFSVVS